MNDFDMTILGNELMGNMPGCECVNSPESMVSLKITNIPKIVYKIIISKALLTPHNENEMTKMDLIYSTSVSEYHKLVIFLNKCMHQLDLNHPNELILYNYFKAIINASYNLNLINGSLDDEEKVLKK